MNKLFRSALMALVIVTASQADVERGTKDIVSQITDGALSSKDVHFLGENEMRETVGYSVNVAPNRYTAHIIRQPEMVRLSQVIRVKGPSRSR